MRGLSLYAMIVLMAAAIFGLFISVFVCPSSADTETSLTLSQGETEGSPSPLVNSPLPQEMINNMKELLPNMEKALHGMVDYVLLNLIKLPKGTLVVDYRCIRSSQAVRSEILDGQGKGTVVLYIPEQKKDQVKCKSGSFRVWRSIERLKLQDTPVIESLLDMVVKKMKNPENTTTFNGKATLNAQLGQDIIITFKTAGEPAASPAIKPDVVPSSLPTVESSRMAEPTGEYSSYGLAGDEAPITDEPSVECSASKPTGEIEKSIKKGEKGLEKSSETIDGQEEGYGKKVDRPATLVKDCYLVDIKSEEYVDTVAIDAITFLLIYAKRKRGQELVFEAIVMDLKTNVSPKMEL